jgi:diaminohydroxyphosphoribosylaminopyrimidine deaminase/5-amino-6-(5-phosphoribosylamino)uracil reductase
MEHEYYLKRCIELARNGIGCVAPNPMVGCVVVHNNNIIGEGWHMNYGGPHAEVNAINSVADPSLLAESTMYVNLEPCNHFGKTPPCADLVIQHKIKRVVVGMRDPYPKVAGNGIKKLKEAGIEVVEGIMESACMELNKRFITFHTKKRPYIILKWAQSSDGYIAPDATSMSKETFEQKRHITGKIVQKLVHKWRGKEDAIMVGTQTLITDNPELNTRAWPGKNPLRVVLDLNLRVPPTAKVFNKQQPTLLFTYHKNVPEHYPEYITVPENKEVLPYILQKLFERNIQSLIIEGGRHTLQKAIDVGLWDETQIFVSTKELNSGIKAPVWPAGRPIIQTTVDHVQLLITSTPS